MRSSIFIVFLAASLAVAEIHSAASDTAGDTAGDTVKNAALAKLADRIRVELQSVADTKSVQYNCSVSLAFLNADINVAAAAGVADFRTGRRATVDDAYAWGSGTKPLTGASIFKLIAEGRFQLDSKVADIVDPLLARSAARDPSQQFTSLGELWGADNVSDITIGHLLNMTSGVPDFDTAKGHGSVKTDSLRKELYAHPTTVYSPTNLMARPWVANHFKPCVDQGPHWHKCYSSTNFMILGLILANGTQWQDFDQATFLPPALQRNSSTLRFANRGAPEDYSAVHGYDRTSYNMPPGELNDEDVAAIDGVFAGWTASDLMGSAADVARLTWAIYGPDPTVLPKKEADLMASTALARDYGYATFNLARDTGHTGPYGEAYGHLGATYGFQSQLVFFPAIEAVLTVATNIETNEQSQPKDALCFAYNGVAGILLGKNITCTYTAGSYYGGGCNCTGITESAQR